MSGGVEKRKRFCLITAATPTADEIIQTFFQILPLIGPRQEVVSTAGRL